MSHVPTTPAEAGSCPAWCVVRHDRSGLDDQGHLHIGGALLVRRTELRLCATIDPLAGTAEGPYVLVGSEEFTLHEAEVLLSALTQLVDQGHRSLVTQHAQSALPVLDP